MARLARTAGKAFVRTLTETGKISAAPRPCTARKAITSVADGTDATPNNVTRQQGPPTAEDVTDAARGNHEGAQREHVNADTHCKSAAVLSSSDAIRGNARLIAK